MTARALEGRVALVTGASRGIGRAVAELLASRGAYVAVNYRERAAEADEVARSIMSAGGEARSFQADISICADVDRLVAAVVKERGGIDVLVNNAAETGFVSFLEIEESDLDRVLAVNLKGVFWCMRAVVPHMIAAGGGRIVNVGSTSGLVGPAGMAHYCASKGGVHALTRAVATELRPHNINVNAVCPGGTDTEMLRPELERRGFAFDLSEVTGPARKLARPSDIAGAVAFLASDDAAWITGALLPVDGGLTAE